MYLYILIMNQPTSNFPQPNIINIKRKIMKILRGRHFFHVNQIKYRNNAWIRDNIPRKMEKQSVDWR